MQITETIFDVVTQQTTVIERDASPEEIAERETAQAQAAQAQAEAQAKATQRAAILERLGLTEEEAAVLLG